MEYHKDRFEDFSLMVFKNNKLISLIPANKSKNDVFSHQGLTFGGVLLPLDIASETVFEIMDSVLDYLKQTKIKSFTVKMIPEIYFKQPANELNYYLLKHNAKIETNHMVLAVDYSKPFTIHKSKLKHYRKNKYDFKIEESHEYESFWNSVLIPRLKSKHKVSPVHTLQEIQFLSSNFQKQIKQFNIYLEDEILAGITVFENETTVKSQYGATTEKGERTRALDYLFIHLIFKYHKCGKSFFSMGTVTEKNKLGYNQGLLRQKVELGCSLFIQNVIKLKL